MHLNTHPEIDDDHDPQIHLLSGQPMVTRFLECTVPQCDFLTNTEYALHHHMIMFHNIIDDVTRDWGIYDVEQFVPIRRMPRSFIDIMEIHCARTVKMIGKFYGACQTVVLFRDYILPKLYTVTQHGHHHGLFKFSPHPSLRTYQKAKHYADDRRNRPRCRMEVINTTTTPWQVVLCLSTQAILAPGLYKLVAADPARQCPVPIYVVEHDY